MRELIPGEDDQSVYEIFFLLTQSGNGREQGTLLGVLYQRRSPSVVWRRAWQRRKLGGAFCCRAAPTCVLEASVTSDTSGDGEGCVRDTADDRADLARASVRGWRVLAIPGKKRW